jgi:hypothetical protein
MAMPTGDTPEKVQQYYLYLQGHHEADHPVATWHVEWLALAWLWGFVIVLALGIVFWVWQYRTTRQRSGIYPVDAFGGYTTELAGPATRFFLLLVLVLTGFGVAIIVGHLVWGQKF